MSQGWVGLTLTRKEKVNGVDRTVDTTDEYAISYAAARFGVDEEEIELVRDNAIIKVRVKPQDEEEIEFMSLEQFTFELYGFPDEDDEFYNDFKQFGYSVWLSRKYPDEWGVGDRQEMLLNLKLNYGWYMLEEFFDIDLGKDLDSPEAVLSGILRDSYIVLPKRELMLEMHLNFTSFELGILVFEDDLGYFVLFVGDDGELYPLTVKPTMVEITEEVFEGFE